MNLVNEIKPYSAKELGEIYGVCDETFKKWILPFKAEIGKRVGRYYNTNQVKIIFDKIGLPSIVKENLP